MTKKKIGVGAVCRAYMRFIHPSKLIRDKYPNATHQDKLGEMIVIRQESRKVNHKDQMCIIMRHDHWPNKELHCVKRWVKVIEEGAQADFFDVPPSVQHDATPAQAPNLTEDEGEAIPERVFHLTGSNAEDIMHIRSLGLGVDDDNEPAPENIPTAETTENTDQTWGWNGINERQKSNVMDVNPNLMHGLPELTSDLSSTSLVHLFLTIFPRGYLENVILPATNNNIEDEIGDVTFGELLRFIGIWFFLATTSGFPRRDFFSSFPVSVKSGAPYRVNMYMSRKRFETILFALSFTVKDPPTFLDRFWQIRDLIHAWNENMKNVFKCGYITCLDESMSIWNNRWTCPGWMFVPRKPKPFGNEYHTICCGLSGILFAMELVEGKDRPRQLPSPPANQKTTQLLLALCKTLYGTGKIVVLDSGFCVLQGLIALKKVGVFAHAVIKKRRYWPKHIPGDAIDERMADKAIGSVDCLKGVLDNEPYNVYCMKEPDYTMKLMATYGSLTCHDDEKDNTRRVGDQVLRFKYTKPFSDHFQYRHAVDDHNNLRHSSPSLEETWVTCRWTNRVFAFILAVTEVNLYLYLRYKFWKKSKSDMPTLHQFRKKLAFAFIDNRWIVRDDEECRMSSKRNNSKHELRACPSHARAFVHGKWDCTAKSKNQQHICKSVGCKTPTRTFCICHPGHWMCKHCFPKHIHQLATSDSSSY